MILLLLLLNLAFAQTADPLAVELKDLLDTARPDCTHVIVAPLEIIQDCGEEGSAQIFLDNLKRRVDAGEEAALQAFLKAVLGPGRLDPMAPVYPVIRSTETVEEMKRAIAAQGGDSQQFPLQRGLVGELVVLYVLDYPDRVAYLTIEEAAARFEIEGTLEQETQANLNALVFEVRAGDRLGLLTADGTYESSLLLAPKLWGSLAEMGKGDVVVAVPARDLVMFSWSGNRRGLRQLRRLSAEAYDDSAYSLSSQLYRWDGTSWIEL